MMKFVLVFVLIILFVVLINNGPGGIESFTMSNCFSDDPGRFPPYKKCEWSYLDAVPPPDFFYREQGPGPLDGYVDSGMRRWADLQQKIKNHSRNFSSQF